MNPTILVVIGPGFLNQGSYIRLRGCPRRLEFRLYLCGKWEGVGSGGGGVAKTSGDFLESGFNTGPH